MCIRDRCCTLSARESFARLRSSTGGTRPPKPCILTCLGGVERNILSDLHLNSTITSVVFARAAMTGPLRIDAVSCRSR
eukprot:6076630-Pleurochrysis_carterae.AAC.1